MRMVSLGFVLLAIYRQPYEVSTKDVNQSLAKVPLKLNCGLAELGLNCVVK